MAKRVEDVVSEVLGLPLEEINGETGYNNSVSWDSVNHLRLVSELETEFGLNFDIDEITAMENVNAIKAIMEKKRKDNNIQSV